MKKQNIKKTTFLYKIIAHNPVLEELTFVLTGKTIEMKPGHVAVIDIASWGELLSSKGNLTELLRS